MRSRLFLLVLFILPALLLSFVEGRVCAAESQKYELKQKDVEAERARFLEKLLHDRKKTDLAITNTKTLIDRSRHRPYLPELYLRLAELYVEKSRLVYFIRKQEGPVQITSLSQLESNALKNQAIEVYNRIIDEFKDYADRDKARFFMAHEYRELGDVESAVQQYQLIIRENRNSHYAPEAFLLLGDHFFNAQDLQLAKRHYSAVLDYKKSAAVPLARYKLAWCYINEADFEAAIELFELAVSEAKPSRGGGVDIDTYKKVDIRLESLIDMAFCYCEKYTDSTPEQAVAYFESHAWSRPALITALEKLANRYFIKKKWDHSAHIYRKLAQLQNDGERLLEYAERVFQCVRATGSFESADLDLALIVKALRKQRYSVHIPEEIKEKRLNDYELYARDIVTHLHQKAGESQSAEAFALASVAYETYLDFFDQSPVAEQMKRNFAEALFSSGRYLESGKEYESLLADESLSERQREELVYGAVVSYYSALENKEKLNAYGKVYARGGLRQMGLQYAKEFPKSKKVRGVEFNVAWVAYEEGNYAEAVKEFRAFIKKYSWSKESEAATHLVLDAHNRLENFEEIVNFGREILERNDIGDSLRAELRQILAGAETKVLYPLTLAASRDWEGGKKKLLAFAEEEQDSNMGEQALLTVIASSLELADLPTLFSTADELLTSYPESSNVEPTLNLLLDTSVKASQFRLLAHYLEEFVKRFPQRAGSKEFLTNAARIREDLQQYKKANADLELLAADASKASRPQEAAQLTLQMAENELRAGDQRAARSMLLKILGDLEGSDLAEAYAQIALCFLEEGDAEAAARYRAEAGEAEKALYGKTDDRAKELIAAYDSRMAADLHKKYMALKLGAQIDNELVKKKSDLLAELLKTYHKIIELGSPKWALASFRKASEANTEFAKFLKEAPMPDLSPDEERQYQEIVSARAAEFGAKATEYMDEFQKLASKWEFCDPELARYLAEKDEFSEQAANAVASPDPRAWFSDPELKAAHAAVMKAPNDLSLRNSLAAEYLKRNDWGQALLIATAALDDKEQVEDSLAASLYNVIGVARLYRGEDVQAKTALEQALVRQKDHMAASINLAGLLRRYGLLSKADEIYDELSQEHGISERLSLKDPIHPRSKESYYAYIQRVEDQ